MVNMVSVCVGGGGTIHVHVHIDSDYRMVGNIRGC